MDWQELFALGHSPLEMIARGSVVYWFLLLVFRFVLRRDVGSMSMADLLFVVLVADASSNAMQGEYKTITDGLILLGTLVLWNYGLDWLAYRSRIVARLLDPPAKPLVRRGRIVRDTLRRELITTAELMAKLREQGVSDLQEVRLAQLESDGKLSVVRVNE